MNDINYLMNLPQLQADEYEAPALVRGTRAAIRRIYEAAPVGNMDAQALDAVSGMASRAVEQVLGQMIETKYSPLQSDMLIPMSTEGVLPYTDKYIYQRYDAHGLADYFVNGSAPKVDISMTETSVKVRQIGGEIGWDWFDIQRAVQSGVPLTQGKYQALERAARTSKNMIMLSGDSGLPSGGGLIDEGFVNNANVPTAAATGGAWSTRTAEQITSSFTGYWSTYNAQVKQSMRPTHIVLPSNRYYDLLVPHTSGSDMTIREYLLKNLPGLQAIEQLDELNTAGSGSGTRMVIYNKDLEVVVGTVPMGFRPFAPQQDKLMFSVTAAERLAGCVWKFPLGGLYVEGI